MTINQFYVLYKQLLYFTADLYDHWFHREIWFLLNQLEGLFNIWILHEIMKESVVAIGHFIYRWFWLLLSTIWKRILRLVLHMMQFSRNPVITCLLTDSCSWFTWYNTKSISVILFLWYYSCAIYLFKLIFLIFVDFSDVLLLFWTLFLVPFWLLSCKLYTLKLILVMLMVRLFKILATHIPILFLFCKQSFSVNC